MCVCVCVCVCVPCERAVESVSGDSLPPPVPTSPPHFLVSSQCPPTLSSGGTPTPGQGEESNRGIYIHVTYCVTVVVVGTCSTAVQHTLK